MISTDLRTLIISCDCKWAKSDQFFWSFQWNLSNEGTSTNEMFWKTENSKFWIDPVEEFNFYATILHYSQTGLWKNKIQNHFLPTHLFKFGHGNANSGMQANTWWSLYLSGNFSTILPAEGLLLSLDGMTSHQNSKSFSEFLKKKKKMKGNWWKNPLCKIKSINLPYSRIHNSNIAIS